VVVIVAVILTAPAPRSVSPPPPRAGPAGSLRTRTVRAEPLGRHNADSAAERQHSNAFAKHDVSRLNGANAERQRVRQRRDDGTQSIAELIA
jgi:hypothetical protein